MKRVIFFLFLQGLALSIFGQKDYLLLTRGRLIPIERKIKEGSMVTIRPIFSDKGPIRGKLEIYSNNSIGVGGDTILVSNIRKLMIRNPASTILGGAVICMGLTMAIGGSIWFSNIKLDDNPIIAMFQVLGATILFGIAGAGVVYTVAGVVLLTRGIVYRTYGWHRYSITVVNDQIASPASSRVTNTTSLSPAAR